MAIKRRITLEELEQRRIDGEQNVSDEQILSIFESPIKLTPADLEVKKDSKQNIKDTITSKGGSVVEIEIDKLCPSMMNYFATYPEDKMEELKSSIDTIGLQEPIIVRSASLSKAYSYPNGSYEILAGHNRYIACKELGLKTIKCNIVSVDDVTASLIVAQSNIKRDTITKFELAKQYRATYDMYKRDKSENLMRGNENPQSVENTGFFPKSQIETSGEETEDTLGFVAEKYGLSRATMHRKIRLAYLHEKIEDAALKGYFTEEQLVNLSYCNPYTQKKFFERYFSSTDKNWITNEMAEKMCELAKKYNNDGDIPPAVWENEIDKIKNKVVQDLRKKDNITFKTEATHLVPQEVKKKDRNSYCELALEFVLNYLNYNEINLDTLNEIKKLMS